MTTDSPKKFSFEIEAQKIPDIVNAPQTINIPNYQLSENFTKQYQKEDILSEEKELKVSNLMTCIKWLLGPISLMQLLFILPQAYPLLATMALPVFGLIGVLKSSSYWITMFGISLVFLSIVQVIVMGMLKGVTYIVVQTIFILFELFCAFICFRCARFQKQITKQDRMSLRHE